MDNSSKIKQKITSVVAASSILLSGLINSPSAIPPELISDRIDSPPGIEFVLSNADDLGDDDDALPEEEKQKRRGKFSSWYYSQKLGIRLLIAIGIALFSWAVLGAIYISVSPAMPVLVKAVFRTVIVAFLILETYVLIAKSLSENIKLKTLLNWKVIVALIIGACLLSYGLKFLISAIFVNA